MADFFKFDANQRCHYARDNVQAGEVASRIPHFLNRTSGVFTGLRVTTGPGLSLNISTGKALVNNALKAKNRSTLSAVNANFNFVILTGAGTITRVTGVSNFPSFYAVLGVAQASGGSIAGLRDLRSRIGDYVILSPGGTTAWRLAVVTGGVLTTISI
jgi:hypothetical protein